MSNSPRNPQHVARAWRSLVRALGYDLRDPHLADTPARVARFLCEWHTNVGVAPPKLTTFPADHDEIVVVRGIQFYSMCAHHGLPFFGHAAVAYLPSGRIVGLSKLARVVDHFARRFQTQEAITTEVADYLETGLSPRGLAVVLNAEHLCMSLRGVQKPGHDTLTSVMRGDFRESADARAEVLRLIRSGE